MARSARDAGFALTRSASTLSFISNKLNNIDFPRPVDLIDVTPFNSTNRTKQYVNGNADATVSISGFWDATVDGYLNGIVAHTSASKIRYFPASSGNTTGADFIQYKADAFLSSYSVSATVDGANEFSADFQLTGTITRTTTTA